MIEGSVVGTWLASKGRMANASMCVAVFNLVVVVCSSRKKARPSMAEALRNAMLTRKVLSRDGCFNP